MEAASVDREAPATSEQVRERLVEAIELDLVGPPAGHRYEEELLPGWERPSKWYLTGFLIPKDAPPEEVGDDDANDEFDDVSETEGPAEESAEERAAAKRSYFPSSMGISALVAAHTDSLSVTVRWGDYEYEDVTPEGEEESADKPEGRDGGEDGDDGGTAEGEGEDGARGGRGARSVWRRTPREEKIDLLLGGSPGTPQVEPVPGSDGLELHVLEREIGPAGLDGHIPAGTRSVSLFLVNNRQPDTNRPDRGYAFQAALEIGCGPSFVPRPDLRGLQADEWDERVADLHFADTPEYATGHGISADWEIADGDCCVIRTRWIPVAEVERTETEPIDDVELGMDALGGLADGAAARRAMHALVNGYCDWLDTQEKSAEQLTGERRETALQLVHSARFAAGRIEQGIEVLARDTDALDAFRVANRAVARALRHRNKIDEPAWRPFQLAFILLNLPGIADPKDPHRETVDLLFFPTGGGKTEAYLGLSAFAIVLRRLRHPGPRAGRRRCERDHALHAAPTHARPARARRRACMRPRARTRGGSGALRRLAVRDRPLGRQGGHAERPRQERGRSLRQRPREGEPVQGQPAGQALADPVGGVPVVRHALRARLIHPAPGLRQATRAAHRLRQLRMRLQRRALTADRGGRRAHLSPSAGVPDRHGRQVRESPVGRAPPGSCSAAPSATTRPGSTVRQRPARDRSWRRRCRRRISSSRTSCT